MQATLADCVPDSTDDLKLWKKDRKKHSWRRLSVFGTMRDDLSRYRQWKDRGRQTQNKHDDKHLFCEACSRDVDRRRPWSTDTHYTHQGLPSHKASARLSTSRKHPASGVLHSTRRYYSASDIKPPQSARRTRQPPNRRMAGTRPVSAPPLSDGANLECSVPTTRRRPDLAQLARVFYRSSIASETSEPEAPGRELKSARAAACSVRRPTPPRSPEQGVSTILDVEDKFTQRLELRRGTEPARFTLPSASCRNLLQFESLEDAHLRLTASQMSACAVTRRVLHGYSERQRARDPSRRRHLNRSEAKFA